MKNQKYKTASALLTALSDRLKQKSQTEGMNFRINYKHHQVNGKHHFRFLPKNVLSLLLHWKRLLKKLPLL